MPSWGGAASGAGAGAAIGSVVPFVGTGIGAGIGGLLGGLFGGGGKDDAKAPGTVGGKDGPATDAASALSQLQAGADRKQSTAADLGDAGGDALAQVTAYFQQLMGGDPAALAQATKAARGRVMDQYDVARQSIGTFSGRGGGTTSASAMSRIAEANALSDTTSQAQADAADSLAGLGTSLAGLGLSAEQLASADLSTLIQSVLGQESLDLTKRGQNTQTAAAMAEGIGTLLGLFLTRDKAA